MDVTEIIAELRSEREGIEKAIDVLKHDHPQHAVAGVPRKPALRLVKAPLGSCIRLHFQIVLDLAAIAASLYSLGLRTKAEVAHVEAELSYTRLLARLATTGDDQAPEIQAAKLQIQVALKQLSKPGCGIAEDLTPVRSSRNNVIKFHTASAN